MKTQRPNILYIHSHDTGRYVQPYGYPISTPNIQQLAEDGVTFRNNFCMGPTCSPSRAALLIGQCPHSAGMTGLAHRGFSLNDYSQHIVHTLRDQAGYFSALYGVQHVAADAKVIGYDRVESQKKHRVGAVAPKACKFLADVPDQPFFLSVGFAQTHRAFPSPTVLEDPRWCRPPEPLPDTPETRYDMACFKATARQYDRGVGMVLDALELNGLRDSTLVICTTDHGIAFPNMKCNLTDHGIGVMLIMRGLEDFTGGKVCDAMVSHVDMFPTLCELLEIDPPKWLEGKSFLPVIRGETAEINDEIYAEVSYHAAYEPQRAVRTKRWKYIRRYDERTRPVMPNCDASPSKEFWLDHGWRDRAVASEQLYDLVYDPIEINNLAGDQNHATIVAEMRKRLDAWMQRTDDPLLNGPVPAPKGAKVNSPDQMSPQEPVTIVE